MDKLKVLLRESVSTLLVSILLLIPGFAYFEPNILLSQSTEDQFEVKQTVTAEITFATAAADITMQPSIAGITGGTGNGGTQFVVRTNNNTGYQLTITASSSVGMLGEQFGDSILNLLYHQCFHHL
ncbi:MAG: hypothetical protein G01um1014107_252 [Parcubacteria group bacterium Gr01-1014_107]|nr:MAG: hypothetical protein G01um1014107_252 [Parcubacteria group bacterium Gr01-1014_107]